MPVHGAEHNLQPEADNRCSITLKVGCVTERDRQKGGGIVCLACWHAICVSSVAGTKSFNFISFAGDTGISSVCRGSRRMAHLGLSQRAPHAKYVHVPVMLCQTQGAESKTHDRMRFTMKQMKRWWWWGGRGG